MPTSPSRKLSARYSRPLGVSERSAWGPRAADFGIAGLRGHGPIAVTSLNFGDIGISNATALAATPINTTITAAGVGTATTICNSSNGYLLINPGTTADTGYNIQWNVADVPSSLMQFYSSPNTTISATRDIYMGFRAAFIGETSVWDGKVFVGLAPTDTALLTTADGTITQATMTNGIGFHIGEGGTISIVASETTGNTISACAFGSRKIGATTTTGHYGTGINMNVDVPLDPGDGVATTGIPMTAASISVVNGNFHDYFFHAHWAATTGIGAASFVEAYFDGKLVALISGSGMLPDLTVATEGDLYPTIEVLNGGTRDCDMALAEIMVAAPRYHIA